jgi:hypothetical protein
VRYRFQPWQLAVLVIALSGGALLFAHWRASRQLTPLQMVQYLPPDRAAHVYIDVASLRGIGLLDMLAGSKDEEVLDYRHFVDQTGFDYRTDLDAVAGAFLHGDSYMVLRGHFDWKRLKEYALAQGGMCRNTVCAMPGSSPERHISFYPIRSDVLALAVSKEDRGVDMISADQWKNPPPLPLEPVWVSIPSYMFTDVSGMPAGTHSFLTPLALAQQVTFAIGQLGSRFQLRAEVVCASPEAAAELASQLTATTDLLRRMITREHMTPSPRDLSGVLVAGSFNHQDRNVTGIWPVERGAIEALAAGQAP